MGGLLFHTERLPAKDYYLLERRVRYKLNQHGIKNNVPRYFNNKEDFGDLDVLIPKGLSLENVKEWLKPTWLDKLRSRVFNKPLPEIQDHFVNGDVISVKYCDFQIDFIRIAEENWEIAYHYFSWNDLGNLIGRLCHKFGLKYGIDGLKYIYREDNVIIGEVVITRNVNRILDFLGLDKRWFHNGFNSRKDIFDFVIESKYFNPYIYDFEHANKINRDRDKKRTTYKEWLVYIEFLKPSFKPYVQWWECDDKKVFIPQIEEFFPESKLTAKIEEFKAAAQLHRERTEKFNGNIVMQLTNLQGSELGKTLGDFKKSISTLNWNIAFEDWIDKHTKEEILQEFNQWYTYKKLTDK